MYVVVFFSPRLRWIQSGTFRLRWDAITDETMTKKKNALDIQLWKFVWAFSFGFFPPPRHFSHCGCSSGKPIKIFRIYYIFYIPSFALCVQNTYNFTYWRAREHVTTYIKCVYCIDSVCIFICVSWFSLRF